MPILASPTQKELLPLHILPMKRNHQYCISQKKPLIFCPSPEKAVTVPHTPEKELLPFLNERATDTLFPRRTCQHHSLPKKELLMPPHKGPPLFCSPREGATAALNPIHKELVIHKLHKKSQLWSSSPIQKEPLLLHPHQN